MIYENVRILESNRAEMTTLEDQNSLTFFKQNVSGTISTEVINQNPKPQLKFMILNQKRNLFLLEIIVLF